MSDQEGTAVAAGGARLGLPAEGPGSLAGVGRRLAALAVDWFAAIIVTGLFGRGHLRYGTPSFSLATLALCSRCVLAILLKRSWKKSFSVGRAGIVGSAGLSPIMKTVSG